MMRQRGSSGASGPTVEKGARVEAIDAVRGVALLGIFVINLPDMAYPEDLVLFSRPPGVANALDRWILILSEVFFSGKMRGLFALIFGASAALYFKRAGRNIGAAPAIRRFHRRLFWLGVFGLLNAYVFLWWGDILFQYAVLGFLLTLMMRLGWRPLLGVMLACLVMLCLPHVLEHREMQDLRADYRTVQADLDAGRDVGDDDLDIIEDWEDALADRRPDFVDVRDAVAARTGGYLDAIAETAPAAFDEQTVYFVREGIADILLYMTLGVLLVRVGTIGSVVSRRIPALVSTALFAIGVGLSFAASIGLHDRPHDPVAAPLWQVAFELGRLAMVIGYLAILGGALSKPGIIRHALAATGRMALTNYLTQSIVGMVLFHEFGLGLFNVLSRSELLGIMCLVWIGQIAFSVLWLRYFLDGPFEWLWRSLAVREVRPLSRTRR